MKKYYSIVTLMIVTLMILIIFTNVYLWDLREESIPQNKITEINRIYQSLQQGKPLAELESADIKIKVIQDTDINLTLYMNRAKERRVLLPTKEEGRYYAFAYRVERIPKEFIWSINLLLLFVLFFFLVIVLYVYIQILRPFHKFEKIAEAMRNRDFSYELVKPKNQFFGRFIWAVDVMREELRQHEEKEVQLMKHNKLMIAAISHDIKTPLSTIRLYSDAAQEQLYPTATITKRIAENCDKIDCFVKEIQRTNNENLFDFKVEMKDHYLHEIQTILNYEKERILLKKIQYKQSPFRDVLVCCDLHRLKEVIGNVIDNAMKYGDGKWIYVECYEEEHHLIIKIENSGVGIDEKDSNAIFQSFYRGNNIRHHKGNGLGLYICKQLMKKMNGDIFMLQQKHCISFHIVLEML